MEGRKDGRMGGRKEGRLEGRKVGGKDCLRKGKTEGKGRDGKGRERK